MADGKGERAFGGGAYVMGMLAYGKSGQEKVARRSLEIPEKCPKSFVKPTEYQSAIRVCIQPDTATSATKFEDWSENEVLLLHHTIKEQETYRFTVETLHDDKTKEQVHVATRATNVKSALENFRLTDREIDQLRIFQAPGDPVAKLRDIHQDWTQVHQILGRVTNSIATALTWFSPLQFLRNGKVTRGWLEVLSYGDTAQGKSEMALAFLDHFGLGQHVTGENSSLAGLLAGVDKVGNQNYAKLGILPRNDRGLLHLDEWHDVPVDVKKSMSAPRSSGVITLSKIAFVSALARVRKLFMANPIDKRGRSVPMALSPFGILHVMGIMGGSPEDVRRLDYVIGWKEQDAITELIYGDPIKVGELRYGRELSRRLVLWAWTRKIEDVVFTEAAESVLRRTAHALVTTYSKAIPLWDAGDSINKLARVAAAVAAHLFSTTDGVSLIVDAPHVEAAARLVEGLYRSPDLEFLQMSGQEQRAGISWDEVREISQTLCGRQVEDYTKVRRLLVEILAAPEATWTPRGLAASSGTREEFATKVLARFRETGMLELLFGDSFKVMPRGVEAAKRILGFWSRESVPPHLESAPARDQLQAMFGAEECRDP
jgi:hypothetical protein